MVSVIELLGWQPHLSAQRPVPHWQFCVALLRQHISPTRSTLKPSSALVPPQVETHLSVQRPVPHWQFCVALLRKHISPTRSALKPSSALAPPRVATPPERSTPSSALTISRSSSTQTHKPDLLDAQAQFHTGHLSRSSATPTRINPTVSALSLIHTSTSPREETSLE
ncbi:hypothetical protein F511_14546 [Dorcoceras hygrometricum]|uniref:Uncharacterized protein n=1 Tax=Dorcoceras hygrometricum TaxID=472368 RepID=A0A2Z7A343_9LAMI|nr:hypothetical protein F511_14546 [Dorcoceras hygrometricum]